MHIDTTSVATVDIDASISRAYSSTLSKLDRDLTRRHLEFVLPLHRQPNTHIELIRRALAALRESETAGWHTRPLGVVAITVASSLIVGFLLYLFGWTGQYQWGPAAKTSTNDAPPTQPAQSALPAPVPGTVAIIVDTRATAAKPSATPAK